MSQTKGLLFDRPVQGDPVVFDEIVAQHHVHVTALARRLLAWPDDLDDVVQEVFLAVLKNLPTFQGRSTLKTWITTITINKCRSYQRKELLKKKLLLLSRRRHPPAIGLGSDVSLIEQETFEQVRQAVHRLPSRYREVIVLCYLEQMPRREVADLLGVSPNVVDVRLNRARSRLKEHLAGLME